MNVSNFSDSSRELVQDELDIKKLFVILWQRKIIVLLLTFIFALVAYLGSYLMTPVWTATAVITKPARAELGNFPLIEDTIKSLDVSMKSDETHLSLSDAVYRKLLEVIGSYDFKRNFWLTSDFYQEQSKGLATDHEKAVLLEKLINDIQFSEKDERKGNLDTVTLRAGTAEQANKLLRAYLDEANQIVIARIIQQSVKIQESELAKLTNALKQITEANKQKQQARIAELELKANEMQKQIQVLNNQADARKDEIERNLATLDGLLNELSYLQLSDLEADYRVDELQQKINELGQLPKITDFDQAFEFLRTPQEPIKADSPRRLFWAFLAALMGGFVGVCVALVQGPKKKS